MTNKIASNCSLVVVLLLAAVGVPVSFGDPLLQSGAIVLFHESSQHLCPTVDFQDCSGTAAVPGTNVSMSYLTKAVPGYGVMHLFTSASVVAGTLTPGPTPFSAQVSAFAGFEDSFTFSSLGQDGQLGSVQLGFTLTGSTTTSPGNPVVPESFDVFSFDTGVDYSFTVGPGPGFGISPTIPIVFGQPTELNINLDVDSDITNFTVGSFSKNDYSSTAVLSTIKVFDSSGDPVNDFMITSASGTSYSASGVIPEPATWTMLGVAMIAAVLYLRTSQRRRAFR
jgi:hypothetical protein